MGRIYYGLDYGVSDASQLSCAIKTQIKAPRVPYIKFLALHEGQPYSLILGSLCECSDLDIVTMQWISLMF